MNRLFIGLGTSACIAFLGIPHDAAAANGSVAASMAKDFWISSKKNQEQNRERIAAQAATRVAVTEAPPAAPVTRPPAYNPRPAR